MAPRSKKKTQTDDDGSSTQATQSSSAKSKATARAEIPPIRWNAGGLVDSLLTQIERKENRIVLCGKGSDEKSKGESRNQVYRRIATALFKETCDLGPTFATVVAERVRQKTDALFKTYKEKVVKLHSTGEGLTDTDESQSDGVNEYADYYVGADGPDSQTPAHVRNIWDQIAKDFPPFQRLHALLSTRPNMVPPIVITGIGPEGRKVVHYQASDEGGQQVDRGSMSDAPLQPITSENNIDPQLRSNEAQIRTYDSEPQANGNEKGGNLNHLFDDAEFTSDSASGTPPPAAAAMQLSSGNTTTVFGERSTNILGGSPEVSDIASGTSALSTPPPAEKENQPVAPQTRPPLSTPARKAEYLEAVRRVDASGIKRVPQKRTLEDRLIEIQQQNLNLASQRLNNEARYKRRKGYMKERDHIEKQRVSLREDFDRGLIPKDEYMDVSRDLRRRDAELTERIDSLDDE